MYGCSIVIVISWSQVHINLNISIVIIGLQWLANFKHVVPPSKVISQVIGNLLLEGSTTGLPPGPNVTLREFEVSSHILCFPGAQSSTVSNATYTTTR